MAAIAYPTQIEIPGPWLIDDRSLQQLDSVFDLCIEKMREETNRTLDDQIEKGVSAAIIGNTLPQERVEDFRARYREQILSMHEARTDQRMVTIYLSGGRTIQGTRFSELTALANVQGELPRGFFAAARVGEFDVKVVLTKSYSTYLKIESSPRNDDLSLELFGYLQNWQVDVCPKKWQQLWLKSRFIITTLIPLWILFCCMILAMSGTEIPKENLKREARALVSQGVNSSNQLRAMQLLLEIESDYIPEGKNQEYFLPRRFGGYFAIGLLLLLVLRTCPELTMGIWAGRAKLGWEKLWVRIIFVTIPGLLLTGVLLPWLYRWLGWSVH